MLSKTFCAVGSPAFAASRADAYTNGQLSMKAPLPSWKRRRSWSSCIVDSDGSTRPELATSRMICAALTGGSAERRPAFGVDDGAARGGHEVVEPHDVALVLVALLEDVALARRELLGHGDHLVPRLGRRRHEVLAVPEQLHVGVQRDAEGLVLPGHGFGRALEDVVERVLLLRARELMQPARLGELGRLDGVHVDHVDALVARGQAPDEQLARRVGVVGERGTCRSCTCRRTGRCTPWRP